jgi:hypothetical protein
LATFDSQIADAVVTMKALANASVSTNAAGLVVNNSQTVIEIDKVVAQLKALVLARSRHAHQLQTLETRLAATEAQVAALPADYRV